MTTMVQILAAGFTQGFYDSVAESIIESILEKCKIEIYTAPETIQGKLASKLIASIVISNSMLGN